MTSMKLESNVGRQPTSYEVGAEPIEYRPWRNGMSCAMAQQSLNNDDENNDFTCLIEKEMQLQMGNRVFDFKYIELPQGFNMYKVISDNPDVFRSKNQAGRIEYSGAYPNYFYNLYVATAYAVAKTAKLAEESRYKDVHGTKLLDGILASRYNVASYKTIRSIKLLSLMDINNISNILEYTGHKVSKGMERVEESAFRKSQYSDDDAGMKIITDMDKNIHNVEFGDKVRQGIVGQRTNMLSSQLGSYMDLGTLIKITTGYGVSWKEQKNLIKKFSNEYDLNLMDYNSQGFCVDPNDLSSNCRVSPYIQFQLINNVGQQVAVFGTESDALNRVSIPSLDRQLSDLLYKSFQGTFDGFWHPDVPSLYNTNRRYHSEICIFNPKELLTVDNESPYHLGKEYGIPVHQLGDMINKANQPQSHSMAMVPYQGPTSAAGERYHGGMQMQRQTQDDFEKFYTPSLSEQIRSVKYPNYHAYPSVRGIFFPSESSVSGSKEAIGGMVSGSYSKGQINAIDETIRRLGLYRLIPDISEEKVVDGCNTEFLYRNMSKDLHDSKVCTIL